MFDEYGRTEWEQRDPVGYVKYWLSKTPEERISEVTRLRRSKWGDRADRPMEKVAFKRKLGDPPVGGDE